MEIDVSQVRLNEAFKAERLNQAEYAVVVCPICRRDDASLLLAMIRCGDLSSLESAFCTRCEHRYFRKLPSPQWYQRYYATDWDVGRSGSRLKRWVRRSPLTRPVWRFAKDRLLGRQDERATHLFPFLLGVVTGNDRYYRAQPNVRSILEVGCGYGGTLRTFHRRGFLTVGTEASPHRVEYCRDNGLHVVQCPIDTLKPVESLGPFDLAYSAHVLEHLMDPSSHLEQIVSLIRLEGYLYLQVPHATRGESFIQQSHSPVHCHSFSPRSLCLLLERHGLSPIRIQVDHNIHVLAQRIPPTHGSLVYQQTVDPCHQLLELFEPLSGEQGKPLRMTWDHASVEISRLPDGPRMYMSRRHFSIAPEAHRHAMEFSFRYADGRPSFPVQIAHPGDHPPVWIKAT